MTTADGEAEFGVTDVKKKGPYSLHVGDVQMGSIKKGDTLTLTIDEERRRKIMSNHTATHVLNNSLRKILGADTDQQGIIVQFD